MHDLITLIYVGLSALVIYFVPSLAARGKRHARAIFLLNLLLGWTVLGWVAALVWAVYQSPPYPGGPLKNDAPTRSAGDCPRPGSLSLVCFSSISRRYPSR